MESNDAGIGALLANCDSDVSDGEAPHVEDSVALQMSQLLPLNGTYPTRKLATAAIRRASNLGTGHGVRVDGNGSSKSRVKYICANIGPAKARVGCDCSFEAVALRKVTGRKRRGAHCGGGDKEGNDALAQTFYWKFKTYDDTGLNYVPHSEDCTALARISNDILEPMLYESVAANPAITGKSMVSQLTARSTTLSQADLPSSRSIYRAKKTLVNGGDAYYNEYWARIETYLRDFKDANPECHVTLEKDPQNHFKRYFVGVKASVEILRHCGIDFFGVDACFTKHHIVNGMQLHLLCGRTGENTYVIIAWSLELAESNDTYQWFAAQCKKVGFDDLTRLVAGPLNRNPVCFADGFKGTDHFSRAFPRLHHALCGLHLSKAIRSSLRRMRARGHKVEVGFADKQVTAICASKTDEGYKSSLQNLNRTSNAAAGRLLSYDRNKWCCNDMAKQGIPTFGHCTSNVVEGTNGVLEPARHKHPYEFLDEIVRYVSQRTSHHETMFQKLHDDGKLLTAFASTIFKESRDLARRRAYKIQAQANGTYLVWDESSKYEVSGHL